ncbi:MAG: copper resistance protein B [Sphingopyxis sp.]|nr:copper resistance protein B [Sphingopyxis sp.]
MSMIALLLLAAQQPGQGAPPAAACAPEHAAMGHCTMPETPPAPLPPPPPPTPPACAPEHAAMGHCSLPQSSPPADVGNAPSPPAPRVDAADAIFGADAMAAARTRLYKEHGGGKISLVMIDLAEVRLRRGGEAYVWDAEARFGGDIDKIVVRTEGEGDFGNALDKGEVQSLWSRAIGPFFDVQAGVRQDFGPGASPTHAVLGIEGLAPYWFDVEGALFLSDRGDVTARLEGSYDQRITQRLIAQPRAEIDGAFQDVVALGIGAGVSSVELGLRLRYEITREFAPYVGIAWERKLGGTARMARNAGQDVSRPSLVAGVRLWF